MSQDWDLVPLKELLTPIVRKEQVDPTKEYKMLGVRLDGCGAFLREIKLGSQISAKTLSKVETNDFIYSRLFAWGGAFDIIKDNLNECYVSNEFPTFQPILNKAVPKFILLWFRLASTLNKVEADCSGSTPLTRNRYKEQFFLNLEIPLPPLEEQQRIVAKIEELAGKIEECRGLRNEALRESEALLGASYRILIGEKPLNNWVNLEYFVKDIENGKSPACEKRPANIDEWGVLKVGVVSSGVYNPNENKALPLSIQPFGEYEVHTGDFLMSRANTTELVGSCAVVKETRPKLLLSDKIFRFIFKEDITINPDFLNHVLKSPALRVQIEKEATGTSSSMKNISKQKVFKLKVPIVPLEKQQEIVTYLDNLQSKINEIKQLREKAIQELDALLPSILDKAFKGEL